MARPLASAVSATLLIGDEIETDALVMFTVAVSLNFRRLGLVVLNGLDKLRNRLLGAAWHESNQTHTCDELTYA